MKTVIVTTCFLFPMLTGFSQSDSIRIQGKYGVQNEELAQLMDFQGLYVESFLITGAGLKDKSYKLVMNEFKNGKLANTEVLFDGTEAASLKVNSDSLKFRFFVSLDKDALKMKTFLRTNRFGSKISSFPLLENKYAYSFQDFLANPDFKNRPVNQPFPIIAIITPTIHKDGWGSYCEVAQSGVVPEKLGEKFNIPHYFIVMMEFK